MKQDKEIIFEESLSEEWAGDVRVMEVPLRDAPFFLLKLCAIAAVLAIGGRVLFVGIKNGDVYASRAQANMNRTERVAAPRGAIQDRFGTVLAGNHASFSLVLDLREFMKDEAVREATLRYLQDTIGMSADEVWGRIDDASGERIPETLVLSNELSEGQLVKVKSAPSPALQVVSSFERDYTKGEVFSSVVGYVGFVSKDDLSSDESLSGNDMVGKSGIEAFYDKELRGTPGAVVQPRDARGNPLGDAERSSPQTGGTIALTIDGAFQEYFEHRLAEGLRALGRTSGAGIAIDPRNGEVLALMSFPVFDNNVLVHPDLKDARTEMLTAPTKPLFNRAVSGYYTPGSTVKPMVGIAALKEGVIDPRREIFSPGYLDIPNPYDPEHPTRYKDWRYQGNVNLASAIAQSSNVYFYEVGGGVAGTKGLGIDRLREWWQKFRLGVAAGIDLPSEAKGFLPSIEWKEKSGRHPWLLGDTYNVSIGQGDLLLTPIQLLDYIGAVANGGTIYQPVLGKAASRATVLADLRPLAPEIREVQKGMHEAVTSPLGTAHLLADLPFQVGAKTGSSQVENNAQENAFFVGYLPAEVWTEAGAPRDPSHMGPPLAILILVEHSREGSLNAVPIAKDVLNWYYWNRIKK